MRRSRSASRETARRTTWRRYESAASSAGSVAVGSLKRSPSSPSSLAPIDWFSETAAFDALRERDLVGGREQAVAAGPVHEQGQRVARADDAVIDVHRLGRRRRDDLDLARLELGAERGQLVLVEVVLEREGFELGLVDGGALLDLVQERMQGCFEDGRAQVLHFLLLFVGRAPHACLG